MFLKGAIKLKKGPSRFLKFGSPWVFSNELVGFDKSIPAGSWVTLAAHDGQTLAYGFFNPHSLIAFRAFERAAFRDENQTREMFFNRLNSALQLRLRAYASRISCGEMGRNSFRLVFGESDGLPGLVVDLYDSSAADSSGVAVIQCHAAAADHFVEWLQEWLENSLKIKSGIIRNDIDVRKKENAPLEVNSWGQLPKDVFALEGGVRFFIDPLKGQKTGYFYDHRDNRAELARRAAGRIGEILDCFSYIGGWGLQAMKRAPRSRLTAVDVSASALAQLERNAKENGLADRVETIETDFFKNHRVIGRRDFDIVICDPPALTSSAKHAAAGRRALENCFHAASGYLASTGVMAFASCSYHLSWDEFVATVNKTGLSRNKPFRISSIGAQGADHPVLSSLPETRYLKSVIADVL